MRRLDREPPAAIHETTSSRARGIVLRRRIGALFVASSFLACQSLLDLSTGSGAPDARVDASPADVRADADVTATSDAGPEDAALASDAPADVDAAEDADAACNGLTFAQHFDDDASLGRDGWTPSGGAQSFEWLPAEGGGDGGFLRMTARADAAVPTKVDFDPGITWSPKVRALQVKARLRIVSASDTVNVLGLNAFLPATDGALAASFALVRLDAGPPQVLAWDLDGGYRPALSSPTSLSLGTWFPVAIELLRDGPSFSASLDGVNLSVPRDVFAGADLPSSGGQQVRLGLFAGILSPVDAVVDVDAVELDLCVTN